MNEDKWVKLSQHISLNFEWLFSCLKAHCKSHTLAPLGKQCLAKQCVTNGSTLMLEGIHLPIQGNFVVKKIKMMSQWILKEIFPLCSSRDCDTLLTLLRPDPCARYKSMFENLWHYQNVNHVHYFPPHQSRKKEGSDFTFFCLGI